MRKSDYILFLFLGIISSCKDDNEIFFEEPPISEYVEGDGGEYDEKLHDMLRTMPYPRSTHELYLNPPPLIVPSSMGLEGKKDYKMLFELSQDKNFSPDKTIKSKELSWGMFNVHKALETGQWYWRFRKSNQNEWSDTYEFTVKDNLEQFVTPEYEVFEKNLPINYPRIYCFMDNDLKKITKEELEKHREYSSFKDRAERTFQDVKNTTDPVAKQLEFYKAMDYTSLRWYEAYMLTKEDFYKQQLLEFARCQAEIGVPEDGIRTNNGIATWYLNSVSCVYDLFQDELSADVKSELEKGMVYTITNYYNMYRGNLENHIFENHVMQYIMVSMLKGCLLLYDKYPIAREALEYYYEHWTARCPAGGFNRDGGWFNGTGYFVVNIPTLWYCPKLFTFLTKSDFLGHPWYKNCGKALVYSHMPQGAASGFGDTNVPNTPDQQRLGFADFISRELNDQYAKWYLKASDPDGKILSGNYELRFYRMCSGIANNETGIWDVDLPDDCENYVWYKDMGEGSAFTDLNDLSKCLNLSFLSSPYASGSHTNPHQNSFNISYGGRAIYWRNGWYADGLHSMMWENNTRGCNSMLIDGVSQGWSTKAYGNITRGLNNKHIAYFLGDASSAYNGESESNWINMLSSYGIPYTKDFGFGYTPLTRYRRHIFMLRPNKVVIYDDLEASSPVQWDWLLHSMSDLQIDKSNNKFYTVNKFAPIAGAGLSDYANKGDIYAVTQQFSNLSPVVNYSDDYGNYPPSEGKKNKGNAYHLTISYGKSMKNRILTIMQFSDIENSFDEIKGANGEYTVGEWKISVNLDEDKPTSIIITNENEHALFNYGEGDINFDGQSYTRKNARSSILYDTESGFQEMMDRNPMPTRTIRLE